MARRSSRSLHALYTSRRSRLPSPADGPGFLYAFVDSDVYWKVGMTSDYDRRKTEWDRQLYGEGKLNRWRTFYWNIGASADLAIAVLTVPRHTSRYLSSLVIGGISGGLSFNQSLQEQQQHNVYIHIMVLSRRDVSMSRRLDIDDVSTSRMLILSESILKNLMVVTWRIFRKNFQQSRISESSITPDTNLANFTSRREGLRSNDKRTSNPLPSAQQAKSDRSSPSQPIDSDSREITPVVNIESNSSALSPPSSDDDSMTTRVNESGNIELCSGKYGPRVKPGVTLSPEDLDDLYEEARRHAKIKSTEDIENVREIIADAFPSRVHRDWFRSEKLAHLGLSLEAKDELDDTAPPTFPFLNALRRKFCGHDWAQVHAGRRDELRMSVGGVGCFDEYLSQVEGCNNRLKGVGNYFTPAQLLTILARGITPTLTAILSEQGVVINESITYKDWITSCRDLEVRFKSRLMSADSNGRRGNFGGFGQSNTSSNNNVPLHKRTATSEPAAHPNKRTSTDGSMTSGPFYMRAFSKMPEAMQKEQRELLGRINACVKCRTAWGTCASNLDKCTGATLTVPWRPLTKEMVDWAIAAHKSTGRPILQILPFQLPRSMLPPLTISANMSRREIIAHLR
ncbi:hypothetical protein C8R41DRAFT_871172 [Lentinula lateritia]|uniref:Uncharacterized protein n=1 Tax=Lentinula lateritia TaxID=40482 RepID=A0ABQ8V1V7_9AGAR|nr:hypothetical protein C8R41DRAFT_871172 [Lentinula lateritia]